MHCNNGLNNKLVESLVENKVAQETGDLKYLQDSMYDFVNTLKEIILGEYSPEFFNKYVDEALKLHGSNLEEFLKIPKMGLELRQALENIDEAIDTSNQDFRDNLVLLLDRFQTTLDNMEYQARDPYDTAVELGFTGTKQEWLEHLEGDSAYKLATLNGFQGSEQEWLDHLEGDSAYEIAVNNGYEGTQSEWLKYIRADGFIQSIQQFATNDAETQVQIPDYGTINSLQGYIKDLFENGGLPATPFATKALMTASALDNGDYAMVTNGGADNGLYVKQAGSWVKSDYDPLTQSKDYVDSNPLFKPAQPSASVDIDTLYEAGIYKIYLNTRAVELGLPSGIAGQLFVSGPTIGQFYVYQTYINTNGETYQRVQRNGNWSRWNGRANRLISSVENLNELVREGNYSTGLGGTTFANNYPYENSICCITVEASTLGIKQTYVSNKGFAFRQGRVNEDATVTWGEWAKRDFVDKEGTPDFAPFNDIDAIGGHLDLAVEPRVWHSQYRSTATAENGFPITGQTGFLTVNRPKHGGVTTQMWQTQDGYAMRWAPKQLAEGEPLLWQPWHGFEYKKNGVINLGVLEDKVATLQADSSSPQVIYGWGSSTLELAGSYLTQLAEAEGYTYVNHGVSGETLAVSGMQQGSNVVTVKFADTTLTNNTNHAVTITQSFKPKRGRRYKAVELSNGVKGLLYFSENNGELANTFKPTNLTEPLEVDTTYEYRAINPDFINQGKGLYYFDIGKNNMGYADTAQDIVDAQQEMIDYIPDGSEYLVGGHFVNTNLGGTDYGNKVEAVNQMLKLRYGLRFCDFYDFLYDDAVWAKYGITKTAEDIAAIAAGELPPSLGRDIGTETRDTSHLRDEMSEELAIQAINRFKELGYIE